MIHSSCIIDMEARVGAGLVVDIQNWTRDIERNEVPVKCTQVILGLNGSLSDLGNSYKHLKQKELVQSKGGISTASASPEQRDDI